MKLYFFIEARFIKGTDGNYYNPGGAQKLDLFKRYLEIFCEVVVVARVRYDVNYQIYNDDIVNGDSINVFELAYYLGPLQYLAKRKLLRKSIQSILQRGNAYILRLPGNIGNLAASYLIKHDIPYAVEVVGDPFDLFSKQGVKHPLRWFFQNRLTAKLKRNVFCSQANLYVTENALQKRYPSNYNVFNIGVSDVKISSRDLNFTNKVISDEVVIISIGTLEQMYKGPDILIRVVATLRSKGVNCRLRWIGTGKFLEDMQKLSKELNIDDRVEFLGYISDRNLINKALDESDIFVLASRTEGLPRVILEAFARGMAVVASRVGGIPELVEEKFMFENENEDELVNILGEIINSHDVFEESRRRNYAKALDYLEEKLDSQRLLFFKEVFRTTGNH